MSDDDGDDDGGDDDDDDDDDRPDVFTLEGNDKIVCKEVQLNLCLLC